MTEVLFLKLLINYKGLFMKLMELLSRLSEMVFLFWMGYQYFLVWLWPTADDSQKILSLAYLIVFEIFMLIAGIPLGMAAFERNWLLFGASFLVFAIFAAVFSHLFGMSTIIWIYGGLVVSRLFFIISMKKASEIQSATEYIELYRAANSSFLNLILLILIMVLVFKFFRYVPEFGLTENFLKSINYKGYVTEYGSENVNIEHPYKAMCIGVLYYGMQFLGMLGKTVVKIVT